MKKFAIALMLGALMLSTLAGCGKKEEEVAPKNDNNTVVESETKVDASETADSVSPTESAESNKFVDDSTVASGGVAVAAEKEVTTEIWNCVDGTELSIELDENGNISNFFEIVNPYRSKIAEMLDADLTDVKSEIKENGLYADMECLDVNVNDIADNDIWLYENRNADYNVIDTSIDQPYGFIESAIYDKVYLATIYKILDEHGISKDSITSFESWGSTSNVANSFTCTIDSNIITEISGGHFGDACDGYSFIFIEVRNADGSLKGYTTVIPCVFWIS